MPRSPAKKAAARPPAGGRATSCSSTSRATPRPPPPRPSRSTVRTARVTHRLHGNAAATTRRSPRAPGPSPSREREREKHTCARVSSVLARVHTPRLRATKVVYVARAHDKQLLHPANARATTHLSAARGTQCNESPLRPCAEQRATCPRACAHTRFFASALFLPAQRKSYRARCTV